MALRGFGAVSHVLQLVTTFAGKPLQFGVDINAALYKDGVRSTLNSGVHHVTLPLCGYIAPFPMCIYSTLPYITRYSLCGYYTLCATAIMSVHLSALTYPSADLTNKATTPCVD